MRSRSRSTSSTCTSTSSPTCTTDEGWSTCFHDSSETCTRPSIPPRSTKAPKFTTDEMTPLRTSPGLRLARDSWGASRWVPSRYARRRYAVVCVLVDYLDLRLEPAPDVGQQVEDGARFAERRGQEAPQADVED